MDSRERIRTIISGKPADRVGFWLGNPHGDTWPIYHAYFGTQLDLICSPRHFDEFILPWFRSPSHEALLPNVPPQNVAAMAEAAVE
jgi:hypothetical protein